MRHRILSTLLILVTISAVALLVAFLGNKLHEPGFPSQETVVSGGFTEIIVPPSSSVTGVTPSDGMRPPQPSTTPVTPTSTLSPESSQIAESCASSVLGSHIDARLPLSERYYSADREYEGDPLNMDKIVDVIYGAGKSSSIETKDTCSDDNLYQLGLLTDSSVTFTPLSKRKYPQVWLIVSADRQKDIDRDEVVATIRINGTLYRQISWGHDIANWLLSDDPKHFSINNSQGLIKRIFDYHKIDNGDFRASQLFLVAVDIEAKDQGSPVELRDISKSVDVAVLGAIWGPVSKNTNASLTASAAHCMNNKDFSIPPQDNIFGDYFEGFAEQGISIGCGYNTQFLEGELGIPFRFNRTFLATTPGNEASVPSAIKLSLSNQINATHLYLVISARNFCVTDGKTVGSITIGGEKEKPFTYMLRMGGNVREARTGIKNCVQGSPSKLLYLPALSVQEDEDPSIVGLPGVPLRARPNAQTDNKSVEVWLDVLKLTLPPEERDKELIEVAIQTFPAQDTGESAFIAVYAATLVHEEPPP